MKYVAEKQPEQLIQEGYFEGGGYRISETVGVKCKTLSKDQGKKLHFKENSD